MRKLKIIIDHKIPFIQGVLEPFAEVQYLAASGITREMVKDVDGLIVRTRTSCNGELLEGSSCRFIGTATIGFDHIDTKYCEQNHICWENAPGCNAASVAQYILSSLLFAEQRRAFDITKKCIGIIGVGHVGSLVEHHCRTIGMNILLNDPPRAEREGNEKFVSLTEIAQRCDIITFHTPLIRNGIHKSYHLADTDFFNKLERQPLIINSSRGEVVDNQALLHALQNEQISDFILDCWENEPHINPLLLENALIATPHIAGYSADGKSNATRIIVNKLARYFQLDINTSSILPPEIPFNLIDISQYKEISPLALSVLSSYNPISDTTTLRNAPTEFEKQRENYGLRREFGAYNLQNVPQQEKLILQELGFNLQ